MSPAFELLLLLALLYVVQGLVPLGASTKLWRLRCRGTEAVRFGSRARRAPTRELGWLPLRPGTLCVPATRLPLELGDDGVTSACPPRRLGGLGAPDPRTPRPKATDGELVDARAVDGAVLIGERTVLRCTVQVAAELVSWLRTVAAAESSAEREGSISAGAARTLDRERAATGCLAITRATRELRWLVDVCALAIFVGGPLLVAFYGDEGGLLRLVLVWPPLHVATLAVAWFAHRKLLPGARSERTQSVFTWLLYPPSLLRSAQQLALAAAPWAQPAALWIDSLEASEQRAAVEHERARVAVEAASAASAAMRAWHAGEDEALRRIAASIGFEAAARARPSEDRSARSRCVVCDAEYRLGDGVCSDCGVSLVVLEE